MFARPLAAQVGDQLGVQILIDNKGGAGGTVGASQAAKMKPDGQTFLVGAVHHTIAPSIYKNLDYDLEKNVRADHHDRAGAAGDLDQSRPACR